jgi:hypothetical protein
VTFGTIPGSPRQFRPSLKFAYLLDGQGGHNQDNLFHPGPAALLLGMPDASIRGCAWARYLRAGAIYAVWAWAPVHHRWRPRFQG